MLCSECQQGTAKGSQCPDCGDWFCIHIRHDCDKETIEKKITELFTPKEMERLKMEADMGGITIPMLVRGAMRCHICGEWLRKDVLHDCWSANLPELKSAEGSKDDSVPAVNPLDLRNVWRLFRDFQAHNPGQRGMVDSKMCEGVCSPGADVMAVWLRASLLGIMQMLPLTLLTPWTHDGELDDAVFKVAATLPMKKSISYNKDLKELLRQIEQAAKG